MVDGFLENFEKSIQLHQTEIEYEQENQSHINEEPTHIVDDPLFETLKEGPQCAQQ